VNRFLFVLVRRSKKLPSGGSPDVQVLENLAARAAAAIEKARTIDLVVRTRDAVCHWERLYDDLTDGDPPGRFGQAIARAEAQVLRLSLVYALLDGAAEIDVVHQEAAHALWRYCRASAANIFGDMTADSTVERLAVLVEQAGEQGLTRTQQSNAFQRHVDARELARAREALVADGRAVEIESGTGGPHVRILYHCETDVAKKAKSANDDPPRGDAGRNSSLSSLRSHPYNKECDADPASEVIAPPAPLAKPIRTSRCPSEEANEANEGGDAPPRTTSQTGASLPSLISQPEGRPWEQRYGECFADLFDGRAHE
jgi:hypothetical protein